MEPTLLGVVSVVVPTLATIVSAVLVWRAKVAETSANERARLAEAELNKEAKQIEGQAGVASAQVQGQVDMAQIIATMTEQITEDMRADLEIAKSERKEIEAERQKQKKEFEDEVRRLTEERDNVRAEYESIQQRMSEFDRHQELNFRLLRASVLGFQAQMRMLGTQILAIRHQYDENPELMSEVIDDTIEVHHALERDMQQFERAALSQDFTELELADDSPSFGSLNARGRAPRLPARQNATTPVVADSNVVDAEVEDVAEDGGSND